MYWYDIRTIQALFRDANLVWIRWRAWSHKRKWGITWLLTSIWLTVYLWWWTIMPAKHSPFCMSLVLHYSYWPGGGHKSGLGFGRPKPVFPRAVGKTWEKLFFPGFGQYLLPKTGENPDLLYDVALCCFQSCYHFQLKYDINPSIFLTVNCSFFV